MRVHALVFLGLSIGAAGASEPRAEVVDGWFLNCGALTANTCSSGTRYVAAVDRKDARSGAASVSVSSESSSPPEFGGVMQIARADSYRGKRVRFFADVQTAGVKHWAGLWLRVDGADGSVLAFDNMETSRRSLTGNNTWQGQSVVLDVPESANAIFFGLVLSGSGKAWLDGARIEVVGPEVPVTQKQPIMSGASNAPVAIARLQAPRNLDFEE